MAKVYIGNQYYGTQIYYLSEALRFIGIDAESVAFGEDPYSRPVHRLITTKGRYKRLRIKYKMIKEYDVFIFVYGQSLFPLNLDLFLLRVFRKKVFFHYLGYDIQLVRRSRTIYKWTNVNYYKNNRNHLLDDLYKIFRLQWQRIFSHSTFVCNPSLLDFSPSSEVLPLTIDTMEYVSTAKVYGDGKKVLNIYHAPTSLGNKGTVYIEEALEQLKLKGYKFNYVRLENVSVDNFKTVLKECDLYIDQLLIGWYGMASVQSMALGVPTVCFYREHFDFNCYGGTSDIPIINANPETIQSVLESVLNNKFDLANISAQSISFVKTYHSLDVLGERLKTLVNI